jgi:signal transduction histidine kinase
VVKEIIIGHGGTIRAENRGGLAVIIRIPVMD